MIHFDIHARRVILIDRHPLFLQDFRDLINIIRDLPLAIPVSILFRVDVVFSALLWCTYMFLRFLLIVIVVVDASGSEVDVGLVGAELVEDTTNLIGVEFAKDTHVAEQVLLLISRKPIESHPF